MKPRKNTFLIFLLGLLLVAFAAATAQTPSQGEQKKKTESCCQMNSCCTEDSCDMKKHDAKMKHDKDAKGECCNIKNKKNKKAV
jgi:hypothetical protein